MSEFSRIRTMDLHAVLTDSNRTGTISTASMVRCVGPYSGPSTLFIYIDRSTRLHVPFSAVTAEDSLTPPQAVSVSN
jgi:hypothetical protein